MYSAYLDGMLLAVKGEGGVWSACLDGMLLAEVGGGEGMTGTESSTSVDGVLEEVVVSRC